MKFNQPVWKFVVLVTILRCADKTDALSNAERLYDDLLTNYYKSVRPCAECGSPLVVNITFHLTSLNALDEVAGEMNSIGYLTVQWLDKRLAWNPLNYSGIGTTLMPYEDVWSPGLLVGNPTSRITDLNGAFTKVRLLYTGLNIWNPGEVFWTKCYPDIYKYPFDVQQCYISFIPWGYLANEIVLNSPYNSNPLPFYKDNGEWVLQKLDTTSYIQNSMSLVKFYFTYKRRSTFLVVNVILPIIFLSFLNCIVFCIPVNCGERISYAITVLLSFAVFMTLVSDNIPKTSAPMSLLCYYLLSAFAMSALIALNTIFNMSVFHRDPKTPVSDRYRSLVMFVQHRHEVRKRKVAPVMSNHPVTITDMEKDEYKENLQNYVTENSKDLREEIEVTWHDVSMCLDTVCMAGYFFFFTITTVVQLLYIYLG